MALFNNSDYLITINNRVMKEEDIDTTVDKLPEKDDLVIEQCFTYQFFENNRYKISESGDYQALCNNGFIKLYTKLCRVYWHTQNQFNHQVHDWKFHVSVKHKDLKKTWNLIAALFIKMKCRAGMKSIYLKQCQQSQQGREITIYLIKYDQKFKESAFAGDFGLGIDIEHSEEYWYKLCRAIEEVLEGYEVQSNGLADGDYPLGKYISFRNECFVPNHKGQSIYPPNNQGWNPLRMDIPINLNKFKSITPDSPKKYTQASSYRTVFMVGLALLTLGLWFKIKINPK